MSKCQRTRRDKPVDFSYALKSFLGYLEGTEKSLHTIKNYQSDLASFHHFLEKGLGSKEVALGKLTRDDLEQYHEYLKLQGFKTNTRRRKILTVRRLIGFLTKRNKLELDVAKKLPAPHKIERIPHTVPTHELLAKIRVLPHASTLQRRNRLMLWMLAETGAQVSEISQMRFEDFSPATVFIRGKMPRSLPISNELSEEVSSLARESKSPWLFLGFNKFGSLGSAISPRGIELLVKSYAPRLGYQEITPRTFRHSAVVKWFKEGMDKDTIQKRLGLKTDYAFRVYDPLFRSTQETA